VTCSKESRHPACDCLRTAGLRPQYKCLYEIDPFTCEVGDFNNKFEAGYIGVETMGLTLGVWEREDAFLPANLEGKSISFHCGDQASTPAFCAAFQMVETQERTDPAKKIVSTPDSVKADFGFTTVVIDDFNIKVFPFLTNELAKLDTDLPSQAACYNNGGFDWHIHDKWAHGDILAAAGAVDCGIANTAGHYDPGSACGPASGNADCGKCGLLSTNYDCQFGSDPYSCEVGDFSAKYGRLPVSTQPLEVSSDFVPNLALLLGKSMVMHCGDGSRAVCAKIVQGQYPAGIITYRNGKEVGEVFVPPALINCNQKGVKCINSGVNAALSSFVLLACAGLSLV